MLLLAVQSFCAAVLMAAITITMAIPMAVSINLLRTAVIPTAPISVLTIIGEREAPTLVNAENIAMLMERWLKVAWSETRQVPAGVNVEKPKPHRNPPITIKGSVGLA